MSIAKWFWGERKFRKLKKISYNILRKNENEISEQSNVFLTSYITTF